MKLRDALELVCRVAVGGRNAKDSLELAPILRFETDETSAYLRLLWLKGFLKRVKVRRHKDARGRWQRTYAYYIERDRIEYALQKNLEKAPPAKVRPSYSAALAQIW